MTLFIVGLLLLVLVFVVPPIALVIILLLLAWAIWDICRRVKRLARRLQQEDGDDINPLDQDKGSH